MRDSELRLIHYYARFGEHKSGVTESIATWLRVAREEYSPELWLAPLRGTKTHRDLQEVRRLGIQIRQVPHIGHERRSYIPVLPWWRIRRGDIVVVHEGWVISNAVVVAIAHARGAICIGVPHGVYEPQLVEMLRDPLGFRHVVERATLRKLDYLHVFYQSEARLAEAIAGRHIPSGAFPNPIPTASNRLVWRRDQRLDYFLWMGRFDIRHKALDELVDLWAGLDEPRPRLILAGPDSDGGKAVIREMIARRGLQGEVIVRDSVEGEEKENLIRGAIGYVHPSRWESCSMVLNEMIGSGVPTLVADRIHAAEPLRRAGLVTTYSDPLSFRTGVKALTGPSVGGQSQRDAAEVFGSRAVSRAYLKWLREMSTGWEKHRD